MAVAVKNNPEVRAASLLDRLPVICVAGVVYILGCLGIVFKLLPSLLWPLLAGMGPNGAGVILGVIMVVAATALLIVGGRLLGPNAPTGSRAGIFVGLVGLLSILLLTRWVSLWLEHWIFRDHLFGASGPTAGAALTAIAGLVLLAVGVFLLFKKSTEKLLVDFEGQGWFSATGYKPLQGQKVRRGTILGILLIALAGIYTMISHGTLRRGSPDWEVAIPFTGMVRVEYPGDVGDKLEGLPETEVIENDQPVRYPYVGRYELRSINDEAANPDRFVKVIDAGDSEVLRGKEGTLVAKSLFAEETKRLRDQFDRENENVLDDVKKAALLKEFEDKHQAKGAAPEPASGPVAFQTLKLLPGIQYTVPLLLLAASIWLAWRVVNFPAFADFLIATEAELNKVSWTTRRRLFQDTIVVLSTVILMAGFLFAMDQSWRVILSWRPIGVLQFPEDQAEQNKSVEEKPW